MSLFHFVLMHLKASDVDELCEPALIEALQSAHLRRAYTVHHDVVSHLEGFRHIEILVDTGAFKGEKIPRFDPAFENAARAAVNTDDDPFFNCMKSFVSASRAACAEIWGCSLQTLQGYKALSLYFDDPAYVYPPPRDDQDGRRDLFGLLHGFASDCARVRQDIDALELAADIKSQCRFSPPCLNDGLADGLHTQCEPGNGRQAEREGRPALAETFGHDINVLRAKIRSPQRPPHTLTEGSTQPSKAILSKAKVEGLVEEK